MFYAPEPFFLCGGDKPTVTDDAGGAVTVERIQSENNQLHSFKFYFGRGK